MPLRNCAAEIRRLIDFQGGGRQPCCISFGMMADHPRTAFHGPNSVLKSLIRPINSSKNIATYRFWRFGLKLPIHAPFGEFLGNISPLWRHPSSWLPKGPSLGGNTSFEPFSVTISATVRPGGKMERKNSITKKVTRVLYFPYLGRSPRWADSTLKLHGGWYPRHNHVCRVSNGNLHGLQFYRRSNFRFSNWF